MSGAAGARPARSPWLIAVAVVLPTFMEVLDTTIANVALRYIAGGLSAPATDSEWVITSYLAANAIILPISGWLAMRIGRRNHLLLSIGIFTLASAACGMATGLGVLIAARVLQGLAGGGLQPSSQGVLLDTFPPERQGTAMSLFGIAALLAPVVGPVLGGFLTDHYGWRWIFYLNLPVGLFALFLCSAVVFDPEHLREERERRRRSSARFDTPGLGLLSVTMVCWEVALSKGQEWDWLGDPHYRVHALLALVLLGVVTLVRRELRIDQPLIDFRTLADRNFRTCCLVIFCAFGVLYANTTTLPGLLQSLFGYDATTSGLVLSPAGIVAVLILVVVGRLLSRGLDARAPMAVGLVTLGLGSLWMSRLTLEASPWHFVAPRIVVVAGLSMLFAPLNVAAFLHVPKPMQGAAIGLLALLRNEGGSVGTTVARVIHERREQFHTLRLGEYLDPLNPALGSFLAGVEPRFLQQTGDPVAARALALQTLEGLRHEQASALAYLDSFVFFGLLSVALAGLVLLMKRAVAEKGAQIAAH